MSSQQMVDAAKDLGISGVAMGSLALSSLMETTASDYIQYATATLVTLRIAYLIWQWVRGKKPD